MLKAYRYRIYPDRKQVGKMVQAFGCARFLYNQLLGWWQGEYQTARSEGRQMSSLPLVTHFKKGFVFLHDVDSLVLMNARRHFETAIKNFFQSRKSKGRSIGFPKFKKKGVGKDAFTTSCVNGNIRITDGKVKLPKLGWVRCKVHRDIHPEGKIVSATVSRNKDGRYHISILVDIPEERKVRTVSDSIKVVGLDMSFSQFVVSSDAEDGRTKTKYVRQYRSNEKKLARLQRQVSRKQKGSANREKAHRRLSRLHQHIADCRKDFVCKQALHYARDFDAVVLEDINMRSMAQTLKNGKSVNDLGFGQFRERLAQKCIEYDTALLYADKWFASSKTCSHCGYKNGLLTLSDRSWVCPECGCVHDRDRNAALNLRDYFWKVIGHPNYNRISNTVGTTEIHAWGDMASTFRETVARAASMNQEVPSFRWG